MTVKIKIIVAVAALLTTLIGCGTTPHKAYKGPERSTSELAVIKWMYSAGKNYYGIVIEQIDDYKVPKWSNTTKVAVAPGEHQLKVYCRDKKYKRVASGTFSMNVEKGRAYVLFGKVKGIGPTQAMVTTRGVVGAREINSKSCHALIKEY